jgi:hypothetical protein
MNVETMIRVTVAARALRQRGGTSDERTSAWFMMIPQRRGG